MSKGCKLSVALAMVYGLASCATYKDLGELSTIGSVIVGLLSLPFAWIAWLTVGGVSPIYVGAVVVNLFALGYSLAWILPLCGASRYREWVENSQRKS